MTDIRLPCLPPLFGACRLRLWLATLVRSGTSDADGPRSQD
jgi:hypothetical protein